MLSKLNINLYVLLRQFVVFTGLIKAGYALGLLQDVYYFNTHSPQTDMDSLYYKYIAAFIGGNIIAGLFYFKINRSLIIALSEIMFAIVMIIFSFVSTNLSIYILLVAGGIAFLAYPFYAKEFVLKSDMHKLFIFLWLAIGLGITYNFSVRKDYIITNLGAGFQIENFTPYFFGSLSIINIVLILAFKQRETIHFYTLQQDPQSDKDLKRLLQLIYKPSYHQSILSEFMYSNNQINEQLLVQSTQSLDTQTKTNQKQLFFILLTAFCAGISGVFLQNNPFYFNMTQIFSDDFFAVQDNSYYYSYLLVLIGTTILGCDTLTWKKKIKIANLAFFLSFFYNIVQIVYMEFVTVDSKIFNLAIFLQFIFQFSFIASVVFFIPFYLFKEHIVILYFITLWIGTIANKIFIYNSQKQYQIGQAQESNYNSDILQCIFTFIGALAIDQIKDI